MKKVIRLTESELVNLVKKILLEQKLDLNIEKSGNNIKINDFIFEVQVSIKGIFEDGPFEKIKILDLTPKMGKYELRIQHPEKGIRDFTLDNDSITKIRDVLKNNPNIPINGKIDVGGVILNKRLIRKQ